jgi:hypothetical protein
VRRETVAQPRWRIQSLRPDGSVWKEALYGDEASARGAYWALVNLSIEAVTLQHRPAGSSRYTELARRPS